MGTPLQPRVAVVRREDTPPEAPLEPVGRGPARGSGGAEEAPAAPVSEPDATTAMAQALEDVHATLKDVAAALRKLKGRTHTLFLDQRNRRVAGEQRLLLIEGAPGEVEEMVIVSPVNTFDVSVAVDGVSLLDKVAFTALQDTGPRVTHVDAEARPDGTFLVLISGLQFIKRFEATARFRGEVTLNVVFASVEVEEGARMTPAPGLQLG